MFWGSNEVIELSDVQSAVKGLIKHRQHKIDELEKVAEFEETNVKYRASTNDIENQTVVLHNIFNDIQKEVESISIIKYWLEDAL